MQKERTSYGLWDKILYDSWKNWRGNEPKDIQGKISSLTEIDGTTSINFTSGVSLYMMSAFVCEEFRELRAVRRVNQVSWPLQRAVDAWILYKTQTRLTFPLHVLYIVNFWRLICLMMESRGITGQNCTLGNPILPHIPLLCLLWRASGSGSGPRGLDSREGN